MQKDSFFWTSSSSKNESFYIFIAHDNPSLNNTISQNMEVLLETKDDNDLTVIIFCSIVYNGSIESVENSNIANSRGGQFLVCSCSRGVRSQIKKFPTRTINDIVEIDVNGAAADCYCQFQRPDDLISLLASCTSRVEVILNPTHSHQWYPYWVSKIISFILATFTS